MFWCIIVCTAAATKSPQSSTLVWKSSLSCPYLVIIVMYTKSCKALSAFQHQKDQNRSGKPRWPASTQCRLCAAGRASYVQLLLAGRYAMGLRWCAQSGSVKPARRSAAQSSSSSGTPRAVSLDVRVRAHQSGSRKTSSGVTRKSRSIPAASTVARLQGTVRRKIAKEARGSRRIARAGPHGSSPDYLHGQAIRPVTRQNYQAAAAELMTWARSSGRPMVLQKDRDSTVEAYLHFLYFAGDGVFAARTALYGLVHTQRLNLRDPQELPKSRQALNGFTKAAPDQQRDPFPWEAAVLVADWLISRDEQGDLAAARAIVIAFDGLLRPSEVLAVRSCDVTVTRPGTMSRVPAVTVRLAPSRMDDGSLPPSRTKSGAFDDSIAFGDSASSEAGRGWVAKLLAALKASTSPAKQLLPISLCTWETKFREAVAALSLQSLRGSPHCLRHGGASSDYAAGTRSLADIQRRGRWHASVSVKRYEKSGRLTMQISRLSAAQLRMAKKVATSMQSRLSP